MTKRQLTSRAALLMLAAACLLLPSCIMAEQRDFVKYDPAKDSFEMLSVLTNIGGKDSGDLDYLAAAYANRDHWITPAIPGAANIFPIAAVGLIRVSDNSFSTINLFTTRPTSFDTTNTTVSLNAITVHPGAFFLENKKVGYYQSITVPGKAIDSALAEMSKAAQTDDMTKGLQAELDRRAAGGKVSTYQDLKDEETRTITTASLLGDQPASQPGDSINPLMVVEEASLKQMIAASNDKTLHIAREGSALKLTLPLTPKDSAAMADLITFTLDKMDTAVKGANPTTKDAIAKVDQVRLGLAVARQVTVAPDAAGLTASVDLISLAKSIETLPHTRIDLNQNNSGASPDSQPATPTPEPDTAAYLRGKNIPLDESLTADQIVKDFTAGTLKENPSPTPVKPGDGIIAPPTPAPAQTPGPGM